MRALIFAKRNASEIIRDPLNIFFGLAFPVILMLLLTAIQSNVPVDIFRIEHLSPGMAVFGLSFMTLFSSAIISKDRETSFFQRLYTTPLTPADFIIGYTLPMIPLGLIQTTICYGFAMILGLEFSVNVIIAILSSIPITIMFTAIGLLFGSILNVKQVGLVCGTVMTNLSAWTSGAWFDISLVGGLFEKIANLLPFIHSTEMEYAIVIGNFSGVSSHLIWVAGYAIILSVIAVILFFRQMKKQ